MRTSIHDAPRTGVRRSANRKATASLLVMDGQSVKADAVSSASEAGVDAGKLVKGRKRHILVDAMGSVAKIKVHSAGVQDRDGARLIINDLRVDKSSL